MDWELPVRGSSDDDVVVVVVPVRAQLPMNQTDGTTHGDDDGA